jgi:Tfp pilus assembly protein PilN
MLRTNLSTRPFYNLRAVRALLVVMGVLVAALTVFNVVELVRLTASQSALGARAADAEREATRLRAEAARIRAEINPQELAVVSNAAREANVIIDQRAFSWTDLLTQFEATLPPDVRITTVQPRLEKEGAFVVAIGVESRRAEDLDGFIEALETAGSFRNVLSISEQTAEGGLIQAIVEGAYAPPARAPDGAGGGR